MNHQIEKVLFSESDIASMVQKLGQAISRDYQNKNLVLVSLMKGSLVFTADLMRKITVPCQLECMTVFREYNCFARYFRIIETY